jgi:DNA-binding NarL/FixJ family response regulator
MAAHKALLEGIRILLVEDMFLISSAMSDLLEDEGAEVVGPVGTLAAAMKLAEDAPLDGALLDINLHGQTSFGVATALRKRDIPLVFVSGYHNIPVPEPLRQAPWIMKPFDGHKLVEAARRAFARR